MYVLGVFTSKDSFRNVENRHQRRSQTSKVFSVCPDSKGMLYIPVSFRKINSCQYQVHFLIPVTLTVEQLTSLAAMSKLCLILHVLKVLGHSFSHHVILTVGEV